MSVTDKRNISMERTYACGAVKDQECPLPETLLSLFSCADIQNGHDALVILLHAMMLECDFVPIGSTHEGRFNALTMGWKDYGFYKVQYFHVSCPEEALQMTCIPLNDFIAVHGTRIISEPHEGFSKTFKVSGYISRSCSESISSATFHNLPELSMQFKDTCVYTILSEIQHAHGVIPTVGLAGLLPDLKFYIMSGLPVEKLVALSAVNHEFHEISGSNLLWKNLFTRDFPSEAMPNTDENASGTWKKLYVTKYREQKKKASVREIDGASNWFATPRLPPFWNPCPRNIFEDDDGFDFTPGFPAEISRAFPHLRRRCQANERFLRLLYGRPFI